MLIFYLSFNKEPSSFIINIYQLDRCTHSWMTHPLEYAAFFYNLHNLQIACPMPVFTHPLLMVAVKNGCLLNQLTLVGSLQSGFPHHVTDSFFFTPFHPSLSHLEKVSKCVVFICIPFVLWYCRHNLTIYHHDLGCQCRGSWGWVVGNVGHGSKSG